MSRFHSRFQIAQASAAVLAVTLMAATPAEPSAPAAAGPGAAGSTVHGERLPNGLEVLVLPEPGREVAAVLVSYRIGTRDEEPGTIGFAHLFEHLMFTGTTAVPDWEATMAALGGRSRSQTAPDWTAFASEVPRTAAARVLALEADRMRGLTLERTAVASAMADIRSEEEAAAAGPLAVSDLADLLRPLAFPGHPYARALKPRAIDEAAVESCRAFYTRHFGPDRAFLVVAGGVDRDSILATVRSVFGPLAPTGTPRAALPPLPPLVPPAERRRLMPAPGAPAIAAAYRVPRRGEPDFPTAKLVQALLAEAAAPILREAVRDGGPPAALVSTDLDEATGLLTVAARLEPGTVPAPALDRLIAAVPLVIETLDPQLLAVSRDHLRLTEAALAGTVGGRAAAAARVYLAASGNSPAPGGGSLAASLPVLGIPAAGAEFATLGPADCARFAGEHLRPDQAVSLIRGPDSSAGATDPDKDMR